MTRSSAPPPSRKPHEPAASLTTIPVQRSRPDFAPVPRARQDVVVLPTPTNDDSPPPVAAFGTRAARLGMAEPDHACPGVPVCLDTPDPGNEPVAPAAMIDFWEHLAGHRLRPELGELDAHVIARQWPNSLLLRVQEISRRPALAVAHMFAPTIGGPTVAIPIDAMTVDWIVALGREVVMTQSPVHETDAVPTARGAITCGVIVLPFGPETGVDHVLCHLYPIDETMLEGEVLHETRLPPRDRSGIRRLFGR